MNHSRTGLLAAQYCRHFGPLEVLQSAAGFYIGTRDDAGPISRESEYFPTHDDAQNALNANSWQQQFL